MKIFAYVVVAALLMRCATVLSSMQTAVPVEPGHVQVEGAYGFNVPLGPTVLAVTEAGKQTKAAIDAASSHQQYMLTEDDKQQLLTAGIALAAMPPGPSYELMVRTGILRDWDAGLKYSTNGALKLDTKFRLLHVQRLGDYSLMAPSFDFALGVGGGRTFLQSPIISALEYVSMGNFNRYDLEVPIYASVSWGDIVRLWVVPKYVYNRTTFDENLVSTSQGASTVVGTDVSLPEIVNTHFVGASVGVGAGYRWVHVMLELTAGYTWCRPYLLGQWRDLGGVTLYPAIGLEVKI
jgi:hypothetical protein